MSTVSTIDRSKHLPALNGFRGLLILPVILVHYGFFQSEYAPMLAVHCFFVLSGFVIARSLLWRKENTSSIWAFYADRMARIFPIYYLTLGFIAWWGQEPRLSWALVYRYNEVSADGAGPLGPMWSLAIEEQFYLFAPFLVWLLPDRYRKWAFFALMTLAFVWIVNLAYTLDANLGNASMDQAHYTQFTQFLTAGTIPNLIPLCVGVLIALNEESLTSPPDTAWYVTPTFLLFLSIVSAGLILSSLVSLAVPGMGYTCIERLSTQITCYTIAAGLFTLALHLSKSKGPAFIKSFLESRPMGYLAKLTYCIYVIHIPVLLAVFLSPLHGYHFAGILLTSPIALVFTLFLAIASQHLFEGPIVRLVKKADSRWRV